MKKMRKAFALVMVLAIVLSMAVSVSAADTTDITINNPAENATYNGYKVLNLSAGLKNPECHATDPEHDANCYNLAYTVNTKYLDVLKAVTSKNTDDEIRAYIRAMTTGSDEIRAFADAVYAEIKAEGLTPDMVANADGGTKPYVFENADQGYWLIEEVLPVSDDPNAEQDHSLTMLTTMGIRDITVNTKRDSVELKKEVYHDDRASWEIVGDDQIGDTVYFHTESHVPDTDGFTELFVYVIHDKMSKGLTSLVVNDKADGSNDSVTVTINNANTVADAEVLSTAYYTVYTSDYMGDIVLGTYTDAEGNEKTKKLTCTDCDFHVVFDIKAALANKAIDDDDRLFVNYSAILNEDATVYQAPGDRENNQARVEYSNNPYDENETTQTPEDETYHYTFKLDVFKTDAVTDQEITGAEFIMTKVGDKKSYDFDIDHDKDIMDENDEIKALLMQFIYDESDDTYTVKPANFDEDTLEADQSLTYTIKAGSPMVKGLDDATDYYLYEIKAPAGYNAIQDPTRIKITVNYDATGAVVDVPEIQIGSAAQAPGDDVIIENSTGTVMPSTGGIGTTLFYVFGGLMAACAAVLLVTKKRMAY